jgi:S1-C subfamily serine protease
MTMSAVSPPTEISPSDSADSGDSGDATEPLDAYSRVVTGVARRLIPSVAALRVGAGQSSRRREGAGSGVVITPDGFCVTSAHVVAGSRRGTAVLADGQELPFEVQGADPLSDLAVVRATGTDLPAAVLGDADQLVVGQLVVAVGNPLGLAGRDGRRGERAGKVATDPLRQRQSHRRQRDPDRRRSEPGKLRWRAG